MKKTVTTFIFMLAATSSMAVGFKWQSSGQVSFGDSLVSALSPNTYTAQLVYLGTGAAWGDVTISTTDGATLGTGLLAVGGTSGTATSVSGKTGPMAVQNSKFTGAFAETLGSTMASGYTVTAGDTFGVFLTYTDSKGTSWYNFAEATYTLPANSNDASSGNDYIANFTFSNTKTEIANGGKASVGGGWYAAVPEPSTAMLALAGLALLIKRRRA